MTATLPLSRTIVLTDLGAAVFTAALAAYDGTTIDLPLPVPTFSRLPSIGTDGTPTVDEIVSLDFGEIIGGLIGTRQILRADNSVVATVTTGSYRLAAAEQIKLRVYAAGTIGLYAETPLITVAAVVVGAITPPRLYFDQARVAGTNPPEVLFDLPDTSNLATDILIGEVTNNGTVTALPVQLSIAALSAYDFTYPAFDNLAPGEFKMRGRYKRERDIDGNVVDPPILSDWSNLLVDTLTAKALPPATTTWDQENKKQLVVLSNDYRDMQGNEGGGGPGINEQIAISTQSRSDERWFEVTLLEQFYAAAQYGDFWAVGICAADDRATGASFPPSFNGGGAGFGNDVAVGTVLTFYIKPASGAVDGSGAKVKDGVCKAWVQGVLHQTEAHDKASYKIWGGGARNQKLRLNTGQEPFAYPGVIPAGVKRFN